MSHFVDRSRRASHFLLRDGGLDPDAAASIAAMSPALDRSDPAQIIYAQALSVLFAGIKAIGVWSLLGTLRIDAAPHSQAALLDHKVLDTPYLAVNSPTFTAYRGWVGDSTSAHLTGPTWNAIPGVAQNSAHHGAYFRFAANSSSGAGLVAALGVSLGRAVGEIMSSRLNNSTLSSQGTITINTGTHLLTSRSSSASYIPYISGVAGAAIVQTSAAPLAAALAALRSSSSYAPNTVRISAQHAGAAFVSDAQAAAFAGMMQQFMATVGAS